MAEKKLVQIPFTQSPPNPSPSSPLQLSGFLSGDTIQVQGDTEDFQFAVQLNIHRKSDTDHDFQIPNKTEEHRRMCLGSATWSYMTAVPTLGDEKDGEIIHREPSAEGNSGYLRNAFVLTRLRSGVLSRVKYFPSPPGTVDGSGHTARRVKSKKRRVKEKEIGDVLERVLRRHCLPVRPCSSYALFVMAAWGVANSESLSFGETSKRLSKMWCNLPHDEKKVYEDVALKDNARYKRQCNMWKNQVHIGEE